MQSYFFYNNETGAILQTGTCLESDIEIQTLPTNHSLGLGAAVLVEQYYSLVDQVIKTYPAKPSKYHEFDYATESWYATTLALELAKSDKNAEINAWRGELVNAPIEFNGTMFDADEQAIKNLSSVLLMAVITNNNNAITWRGFDNVDYLMTLASLQDLAAAIQTRTSALYAASWAHKAAVDALHSVSDVLSYQIQ